MKRVIGNFILVFLSVAVTLGGLELILRMLYQRDSTKFSRAKLQSYYAEKICLAPPSFRKEGSARTEDPFLGFRFVPHAKLKASTATFTMDLQLDALGFRANEENFVGNEELLWFLGDSHTFTFVQEVEDAFPKVAEMRLNELAGEVRFRALLHGVVGWGTVNVSKLAHELEPSIDHRMAVLGFCVSNDVINNLWYKESEVWEPAVQDTATVSRIMNELAFPILYRSILMRQILRRLPLEYFLRYEIMVRDESLERTRRELSRLLEVVGEGQLVVVIIPLLSQVTDSWVAWFCNLEKINRTVISWCEENDVPCLDLLDHIKGNEEYFYTADNHFNIEGNHVVGKIIGDFLAQNTDILDLNEEKRSAVLTQDE
jgi:hypothetical protein